MIPSIDERMDAILRGLRDTRPATGFEDRMLTAVHAVATRQATSAREGRRKLWPFPSWAQALAMATVTALLLFTVVAHHHGHQSASVMHASAATQSAIRLSHSVDASRGNHGPEAYRSAPRTFEQAKPAAQPKAIARDNESDLALAESRAPSLPAPVAPLTQQERLLIIATRSGELSQLAELQPAHEAFLRSSLRSRQDILVERYIAQMLSPLAASESLSPTQPSDAADSLEDPQPTALPTSSPADSLAGGAYTPSSQR
jgi:hypothetical protein